MIDKLEQLKVKLLEASSNYVEEIDTLIKKAMIVKDLSSEKDKNVIIYKGTIYLYDDLLSKKSIFDLEESNNPLLREFAKFLTGLPIEIDKELHVNQITEELSEVARSDVITGFIYDNIFEFKNLLDDFIPLYSANLIRMLKFLNLDGATAEGLGKDKVWGTLELDIVHRHLRSGEALLYHGTCSKNIKQILKKGLVPSPTESNFKDEGVSHPEHVFLTANFKKASFHAFRASNYEHQPIILQFRIPDPSKLCVDYDVDNIAGPKKTYNYSTNTQEFLGPVREDDYTGIRASHDFGTYGYFGRIPASFITGMWIVPMTPGSEPDGDEFYPIEIKEYLEQLDYYYELGAGQYPNPFTTMAEIKESIWNEAFQDLRLTHGINLPEDIENAIYKELANRDFISSDDILEYLEENNLMNSLRKDAASKFLLLKIASVIMYKDEVTNQWKPLSNLKGNLIGEPTEKKPYAGNLIFKQEFKFTNGTVKLLTLLESIPKDTGYVPEDSAEEDTANNKVEPAQEESWVSQLLNALK